MAQSVEKDHIGSRIADAGWRSVLRVNEGCRKLRWATGEGDFYLGLFLSATVTIMAFLGMPSSENAILFSALMILNFIITMVIAPTILRLRLVAPLGIPLVADARTGPYPGPVVVMIILLVASGVADAQAGLSVALVSIVNIAISVTMLYGYIRSGRNELVLLAIASTMLALLMVELIADVNQRLSPLLAVIGFLMAVTGARQLYKNFLAAMLGQVEPERVEEFVASKDASVRLVAASFMTNYLEPRFLTSIIKVAEDSDIHVRRTGELALARIWGPSEIVEQEWFQKNYEKLEARGTPSPEALELLSKAQRSAANDLKSHRDDISKQMKIVVQDTDTIDALRRFVSSADHTNPQMNAADAQRTEKFSRSAARLLVSTDASQAYASLMSLVDGDGKKAAKIALEAMAEADGVNAVAHLAPYIEDPRTWVASKTVESLGEIFTRGNNQGGHGKPVATALVVDGFEKIMGSTRNALRGIVVWLTVIFEKGEAIDRLRILTEDRNWFVRGEAVCAMSSIDTEEALPYVLRAVSDDHSYVRISALRSLSLISPVGIAPILQRLTQDTSEAVARTATQLFTIQAVDELGEQRQ